MGGSRSPENTASVPLGGGTNPLAIEPMRKRSIPPLVSVLMTVYNRQQYVEIAIQSVLSSTYQNFELVIVDDASSDLSFETIQKSSELDARIKAFRNKTNLGDYSNRNRAAEYASGEYLKYVDSDDVLHPFGLETMVACISSFPEAGLGLSCSGLRQGPHPQLLSPRESYKLNYFQESLFSRAPGSSIIKTSSFRTVGGFSGKRQVGDHELWHRLAAKYPVVTMPRDLIWTRIHAGQEQSVHSPSVKAKMHYDVQLEHLLAEDCPLSADEKQLVLTRLRDRHRANFWKIMLSKRKLTEALHYKSCLGLAWNECLFPRKLSNNNECEPSLMSKQ